MTIYSGNLNESKDELGSAVVAHALSLIGRIDQEKKARQCLIDLLNGKPSDTALVYLRQEVSSLKCLSVRELLVAERVRARAAGIVALSFCYFLLFWLTTSIRSQGAVYSDSFLRRGGPWYYQKYLRISRTRRDDDPPLVYHDSPLVYLTAASSKLETPGTEVFY